MNKKTHTTREGWLNAAMVALDKKFFSENGYDLPEKLQVSCGFPRGGGGKAIGQCWDPTISGDGTTQMFICPSQSDPITVLGILLHEMIHAVVGLKAKHGGPFRKLVKEFGLAGKMTATFAEEGSEVHKTLEVISGRLGAYPHAAMQKRMKRPSNRGPGWIRLVSPENPEYKSAIDPNVMEELGAPRDPWGNEMVPCRRKGDK
jgi:hypothetical protein